MNETPEFIDTYSDDLLYLMDLRDSHLTHPGKVVIDFLFQASMSRLFCVFMIGGIEAMIEDWRQRDTKNILAPYYIKSSNEDRITALTNSFKVNGIDVDEKILKQYLAIKYVRNTIVHSGWNENQKDFINEQGFPTDTRSLTDDHLQIMYAVNNEMMMYVASIQLKEYVKLGNYKKLPDYKKYFTKEELATFLWQNLEKINHLLYKRNEITHTLIEEVLYDWKLYKEIALKKYIDIEKIESSTVLLQRLVDEKRYSQMPIGYFELEKINLIKNDEFLEPLSKVLNLNKDEISSFVQAFSIAKKCYEKLKNITASSLLKKLAASELAVPSLNIEQEAEVAEKIFKLGRLYYHYAERI